MNIYPRLKKEFTKEEIISQYENNEIDINFIAEYISTQDNVYNKLIDRANFLEEENEQLKQLNKIVYVDKSKKVLDELEEWLEQMVKEWCSFDSMVISDRVLYYEETLKKLKELKGSKVDE
ncbi:MAG: hypothetical protein J6B89_03530 [Bacilli bacterium]|nr:hypothetical protein [Bacilli bacterium]